MNTFIKGDEFWISFNPETGSGPETALCQRDKRPNYLILIGDHLDAFRPVVSDGYDACLAVFKQLVSEGTPMSMWSEAIPE